MKPMYQPYDNGIIPTNRAFSEETLKKCVEGILIDAKKERYEELNKTHDWLNRCKKYTEETLENFDRGIDGTGSKMQGGVGGARYVNEKSHHTRKLKRIEAAIRACEDKMVFSV